MDEWLWLTRRRFLHVTPSDVIIHLRRFRLFLKKKKIYKRLFVLLNHIRVNV